MSYVLLKGNEFMVFWVIAPCSVLVRYQCFGGPCHLHLHGCEN